MARVLSIAALTTFAVTLLSRGLPADHAATGVSFAFLAVVYWLVLRSDQPEVIRGFGLSFGGLFEPQPLEIRRVIRASSQALGVGLLAALVFFPPFTLGWLGFWRPAKPFLLTWLPFDEWVGQLLVIALPEEIFYRGYVQSSLDQVWRPRRALLGAHIGPSLVVTSAIFAVGHVLTEAHPYRLAVFFPALVFGWLRARTGGVGASIVFHALCNLFASHLAQSYGFGGS